VAAHITRGDRPLATGGAEQRLLSRGLEPRVWSNGPGFEYAPHSHGYHKVLYCTKGSIVFHVGASDFELHPGDRLDVDPATEHAATVGPDGVECVEAASS